MDERAESSRSGAHIDSGPSDDGYNRSPDARMNRRRSPSRSRSASDASMSSRSPSPFHNDSPSHSTTMSGTRRDAPKIALRVDYLTHNVRSSHLHHIFGWYGRVERVDLTTSTGKGKERDGWAWVVMGSVEEAAKAALYMGAGQIDGARIRVQTCHAPEKKERAEVDGRERRERSWSRARGSHRSDRDEYADRSRRTGREDDHWRSARDGPISRGVHPDRQLLMGSDSGRERFTNGSRNDEYKVPMRKWGQAEPTRSRSNHSRDRSMSPHRRGPPSY